MATPARKARHSRMMQTKHRTGVCLHCAEDAEPGYATCMYHRLRTRLRQAIIREESRLLRMNLSESEKLTQLRAEYAALQRERS